MKKKTFIFLFVGVHVFFIVFQIDKQSRMVRLSYNKQKDEQEFTALKNKKQALINKLYVLKNKKTIKEYANAHLGMKPLKLNRVKRISSHGQNT